jgi:Mn-dependent DtxR family transcriptional regulator
MNKIIKMALENVVLCRGAHTAKESYEYAEKMEAVIKSNLVERLKAIALNPGTTLEDLDNFITELEK